MIDCFYSSGISSLFQIELISLWVSERNVLSSALISSAGIWSIPGDLFLFSLSIAISTWKALGSSTSGYAVCISVCLISLNPWTFNSWEKWFLHIAKILWESVIKQITLLFLYYISSRLVTLLQITEVHIKVSDIFYLTLSFNFINFSFKIFTPEMSTIFASYIV